MDKLSSTDHTCRMQINLKTTNITSLFALGTLRKWLSRIQSSSPFSKIGTSISESRPSKPSGALQSPFSSSTSLLSSLGSSDFLRLKQARSRLPRLLGAIEANMICRNESVAISENMVHRPRQKHQSIVVVSAKMSKAWLRGEK